MGLRMRMCPANSKPYNRLLAKSWKVFESILGVCGAATPWMASVPNWIMGLNVIKTPWFTVKSRHLAPPARLELTTLRLGGARSIQVSYGGMLLPWHCNGKFISCQQNRGDFFLPLAYTIRKAVWEEGFLWKIRRIRKRIWMIWSLRMKSTIQAIVDAPGCAARSSFFGIFVFSTLQRGWFRI